MSRTLKEHFHRRIIRISGFQLRRLRELVIEPTNYCTQKCPVCGAFQAFSQRSRGFIDWNLFLHIVKDAVKLKPERVSLYAHGEPLLHPLLVDMVVELTSSRLQSNIVTNGDLLIPRTSQALLEAGLQNLVISYPGVSELNYKICRGNSKPPALDERIIESLRFWDDAKGKAGIRCLIITNLLSNGTEETSAFLRKWLNVPGVNYVTLHGYLPWPQHFREDLLSFLSKIPQRCELGMDSLTVLWDGTVTPCSYDCSAELEIGDIQDKPLGKIYNSSTLRKIRKMWFRKPHQWPSICRSCLIPRCPAPYIIITREEFQRNPEVERKVSLWLRHHRIAQITNQKTHKTGSDNPL
ncbi:MAG: radical SAM/SPASM domain-containing protein [Candidatus Aminicenantaceae bacterium]